MWRKFSWSEICTFFLLKLTLLANYLIISIAFQILTAAHCTRDSRQRPFAARQFTVRLGDVDLSVDHEPSEPVTYKVKEIRAHPRFSRVGFYNDIAGKYEGEKFISLCFSIIKNVIFSLSHLLSFASMLFFSHDFGTASQKV